MTGSKVPLRKPNRLTTYTQASCDVHPTPYDVNRCNDEYQHPPPPPPREFHSPPTLVLRFWKLYKGPEPNVAQLPGVVARGPEPYLIQLEDSRGSRSPSNTQPRHISGTDSGLPDSGETARKEGMPYKDGKPVTVLVSLQATPSLSYRLYNIVHQPGNAEAPTSCTQFSTSV